MAFVLDASVAISWCFPGDPNEDTRYSRQILTALVSDDAIVPEVWPFEVANAIFVSFAKRKSITEPQIREFLDLLKSLPIRIEAQTLGKNLDLESSARRWNLAAYDAAYLDLARRAHLPIATSDAALRDAAAAGVRLI